MKLLVPPQERTPLSRDARGRQDTRRAPRSAFTLIEVILAIVIAVGLLVVVLHFYQQSAELRGQIIQETERIAAVRLLMERLTAELRSATSRSSSRLAFAGDATSLRFVTAALPSRLAWNTGSSGQNALPEIDLKLVSYSLASAVEGSNTVVTGLVRTEQPTFETRQRAASTQTNQPVENLEGKAAREIRSPQPVTDAIRYLRFRYFDGEAWQESWSLVDLPQAVEVSLAGEPPPERTESEDYPIEVFRRVIYLPGHEASAGLGLPPEWMDEGAPEEALP